jgi:hypothetical protein
MQWLAHCLNDLLSDVLEIANASSLPAQNINKATTLATWILQTQTLPFMVLQPRMPAICALLLRNICSHPGRHGRTERISDSLKVGRLFACHILLQVENTFYYR